MNTRWWAVVLAVVAVTAIPTAAVRYDSVAEEVGVVFQHAGEIHPENEPQWPSFPEIMGSGACFGDFDGDGLDDLYIVDQYYNPENPAYGPWADDEDPVNRLFLNGGDGSFTDATDGSGADDGGFGMGCSAADYDADGDLDLYVTNFGPDVLLRNDGGASFTDATDTAGVGMDGVCAPYPCWGTSSAWADYDGDGDLDLYVGNYVGSNLTDVHRGPEDHLGQVNRLFRNGGNGTFTEVAGTAGVAGHPADENGSKTLGVVWFDADWDDDPDLYVANDGTPNDFYENRGDGTFVERSAASGLDDPLSGMGVAAGDYDADGYEDLFFTHYQDQHNGFYRNLGDGTFEDRSGEDDLAEGFEPVGWGTEFVDVDRDGDLDIAVANGHTDHLAALYDQQTQLFLQSPDPATLAWNRTWTDVSNASGPGVLETAVSRGAAFSDYDLDGDTDVALVNNANESAQVLRASEVSGRWLYVHLVQPGGNPSAVGARVAVKAPGIRQLQTVRAGSSYLSQNGRTLEFGLGEAVAADRIVVDWPDGNRTVLEDVAAGQLVRIDRATGSFVNDTISPVTEALPDGTAGQRGWFTSDVDVTLSARDRGVSHASGVAETSFRLDGGPWTGYDGPVAVSGDGVHALAYRSEDAAGNVEPVRRASVKVDTETPASKARLDGPTGEGGWWTGPVTVTLEGSDATSGVDRIEYRVDGDDWTIYEEPFSLDTDGSHVIEHAAFDVAGNREAPASVSVPVDGTPPEVDLAAPRAGSVYRGGDRVASVETGPTLVLVDPAVDPVLDVVAEAGDRTSGLDRAVLTVDGAVVGRADTRPYRWSWDAGAAGSGLHRLTVTVHDVAGHATQRGLDMLVVQAP